MIIALKIEISMLFNLVISKYNILSWFFFSFSWLLTDYFLVLEVIAQIFKPTAELPIPIGMPTKEVNAAIETQPLIPETTISKFSVQFTYFSFFCALLAS